jgi:hypothetical protein
MLIIVTVLSNRTGIGKVSNRYSLLRYKGKFILEQSMKAQWGVDI